MVALPVPPIPPTKSHEAEEAERKAYPAAKDVAGEVHHRDRRRGRSEETRHRADDRERDAHRRRTDQSTPIEVYQLRRQTSDALHAGRGTGDDADVRPRERLDAGTAGRAHDRPVPMPRTSSRLARAYEPVDARCPTKRASSARKRSTVMRRGLSAAPARRAHARAALVRRDDRPRACAASSPSTQPVGRIPTQTDFDDYRDVGGVKVPFTVRSPASTAARTRRGSTHRSSSERRSTRRCSKRRRAAGSRRSSLERHSAPPPSAIP